MGACASAIPPKPEDDNPQIYVGPRVVREEHRVSRAMDGPVNLSGSSLTSASTSSEKRACRRSGNKYLTGMELMELRCSLIRTFSRTEAASFDPPSGDWISNIAKNYWKTWSMARKESDDGLVHVFDHPAKKQQGVYLIISSQSCNF
jgi:hypothetical protein